MSMFRKKVSVKVFNCLPVFVSLDDTRTYVIAAIINEMVTARDLQKHVLLYV